MADDPASDSPKATRGQTHPAVLFGLMAVFALVGAGFYVWGQQQPHGVAAPMPATAATSRTTGQFAQRLVGRWRPLDGDGCAINVALQAATSQLAFATGERVTRHRIESDKPLETRTRVVGPDPQADHTYVLTPEFFATSEARSFNLVVKDATSGRQVVWAPCELP